MGSKSDASPLMILGGERLISNQRKAIGTPAGSEIVETELLGK
jgi:hypothetical protein